MLEPLSHASEESLDWAIAETLAAAGAAVLVGDRDIATAELVGKLAVSTGCNRLLGNYTLTGKQLKISATGITMMSCSPAILMQERKLLDLLPGLTQFKTAAQDALILQTSTAPA